MDKDIREVNLDDLEGVVGGVRIGLLSQDDGYTASSKTRVSTKVNCKYCGNQMSSIKKGNASIYTCTCGSRYDPRLPDPWTK